MRSRRTPFLWLLDKEWRELLASKSWWTLLLVMGPLVGASFLSATRTYAEVSGLNGTSAGVGEALSPLIGVWAPTFSACELAAVFLLPFVAIRVVAGDRQSGALKLEAQHSIPAIARVSAKALVLLAGWTVVMLPAAVAIPLWKASGGVAYPPELLALALGHCLNGGLTVALAAAMASIAEHPSTAAILTLAVTVGTWLVNFFAAIQGGWWERAAAFTPAAMVSDFQRALVRLDVVLIASTLIAAGLVFTAIWLRPGVPVRRRIGESSIVAVSATVLVLLCPWFGASWDASENRGNSFSRADEQALRRIRERLRIVAHLAPKDPRRSDLEHRALSKLRRVLPDLEVSYVSATSIGLFEQTGAHYGEIWYELGGRKTSSRVTTAEGVLECVYEVAGIPPPGDNEPEFRGHPLTAQPAGAGLFYYGAWPVLTLAAAIFARRRIT